MKRTKDLVLASPVRTSEANQMLIRLKCPFEMMVASALKAAYTGLQGQGTVLGASQLCWRWGEGR